MSSETILCKQCNQSFDKKDLQIVCSNCFACTGCERYVCPKCNNAIVISPVKSIFSNTSDTQKNE